MHAIKHASSEAFINLLASFGDGMGWCLYLGLNWSGKAETLQQDSSLHPCVHGLTGLI